MANISQEVNIELLEKKPDGSYIKKNPATRISAIEDFRINNKRHLEFYNGVEWTKATSEGYRVGNVSNFAAGEDDRVVTLILSDPPNTTITDSLGNEIIISKWGGTMVRRKLGSYPIDEDDGELVFDNRVRDRYKVDGYKDTGLINDTEYFYMAFPYTEEDLFTVDSANRISATPTEVDPNSWQGIQKIVRKGIANEFFSVGDQIASGYDGGEVIWEVIGIDVDTPVDSQLQHSMTIQTRDCLENRVFDAGSDNRYINSPIRQYLNNEFLNKLDPELSAVIGKVDKKVAKRDNLGGGQDSFSDKVFLLSRVEVDLGTEGTTTGEKVYPFYDGVANAARIKNLNMSPRDWWLRSPNVGLSHRVRYVHPDGSLDDYGALSSLGVPPACAII